MVTKFKVILLVIGLVLIGAAAAQADMLMPMQIGGYADYACSDNLGRHWTARNLVIGTETFNGVEYFKIQQEQWFYNQPGYSYAYLRSTETQAFAYNTELSAEALWFQQAPVGTSWTYAESIGSTVHAAITNIGTVMVPFGSFDNAYEHTKYSETEHGTSPNLYEYIVPGVGLVKNTDWWVYDPAEAPVTRELSGMGMSPVPAPVSFLLLGSGLLGILGLRGTARKNL